MSPLCSFFHHSPPLRCHYYTIEDEKMQGGKRNFLGNSSVFPSELVKIRPQSPFVYPLTPFTYFYTYNFNLLPFLNNKIRTDMSIFPFCAAFCHIRLFPRISTTQGGPLPLIFQGVLRLVPHSAGHRLFHTKQNGKQCAAIERNERIQIRSLSVDCFIACDQRND